MKNSWQLRLPGFALAALLSLVLCSGMTSCEDVATDMQPSIVRVIDASYAASAVNVNLEGASFATNIAHGAFSKYGALKAKRAALISIAAAAGGRPLVSTSNSMLPGQQQSILITDGGSSAGNYHIALLDDQRTAAALGHSAFRFINQGPKAGPVDIYMVPNGVTLANAVPVVTDLAPGSVTGYVNFTSQSVRMIVTESGAMTVKYMSPAIDLSGGEVRTALIMDSQSNTTHPVTVFMGSDVN